MLKLLATWIIYLDNLIGITQWKIKIKAVINLEESYG